MNMGGMQYFFRVTLLEGIGENGIFRLEECDLPRGVPRPENIPYKEVDPRVTYKQLLVDVCDERVGISQKVLRLSPENPQVEHYYDWYMGI